jgi:hypothetical protein
MAKNKPALKVESPPTWTATERNPDTGLMNEQQSDKREGGTNEPISEAPAAPDQE